MESVYRYVSIHVLQTLSLMRHRLGDSIHIEEYTVGKCLLLSYWRFASCRYSSFFLGSLLNPSVYELKDSLPGAIFELKMWLQPGLCSWPH